MLIELESVVSVLLSLKFKPQNILWFKRLAGKGRFFGSFSSIDFNISTTTLHKFTHCLLLKFKLVEHVEVHSAALVVLDELGIRFVLERVTFCD